MNHFVVLVSLERGRGDAPRPGAWAAPLSLEQLSPHFTGVALELIPAARLRARGTERQTVRVRELLGRSAGSSARWRRSCCWRWRWRPSCC
jgi:ATP-binding cassette subfamily B protein RaxB